MLNALAGCQMISPAYPAKPKAQPKVLAAPASLQKDATGAGWEIGPLNIFKLRMKQCLWAMGCHGVVLEPLLDGA